MNTPNKSMKSTNDTQIYKHHQPWLISIETKEAGGILRMLSIGMQNLKGFGTKIIF